MVVYMEPLGKLKLSLAHTMVEGFGLQRDYFWDRGRPSKGFLLYGIL